MTEQPSMSSAVATSYLKIKLGNKGSKKIWTEDRLNELKDAYKDLNKLLDVAGSIEGTRFDPDDQFSTQTIRFLKALSVTFTIFSGLVDEEKAAAGGIDFTDIIRNCRQLFRDHHDLVAAHYRRLFRYILVDEFQDPVMQQELRETSQVIHELAFICPNRRSSCDRTDRMHHQTGRWIMDGNRL
jgi:ATP-dependent exoDNAse (exonuclease V) beta subunit